MSQILNIVTPVDEDSVLSQWTWDLPEVSRVLVLAPHPDDEVFGCAGTLLKLKEKGAAIHLCVVTDGSLGGDNLDGQLVKTRAEESRRAAAMLGFNTPEFLSFGDRELRQSPQLVDACRVVLDRIRPQLVFVTAPTEPHPDHCALALALGHAVQAERSTLRIMYYEVGYPLPQPNLMQDITEYKHQKIAAMRCFASQLQERPYHSLVASLNHYRSYPAPSSVTSVEAFVIAESSELQRSGLPAHFDWPILCRHLIVESRSVEQECRFQLAERDRKIAGLEQQLFNQSQRTEHLELAIREIYASRSWRLTRILRRLRRVFGGPNGSASD